MRLCLLLLFEFFVLERPFRTQNDKSANRAACILSLEHFSPSWKSRYWTPCHILYNTSNEPIHIPGRCIFYEILYHTNYSIISDEQGKTVKALTTGNKIRTITRADFNIFIVKLWKKKDASLYYKKSNMNIYAGKVMFLGVYIIFLILAQNIDCGYLLELPQVNFWQDPRCTHSYWHCNMITSLTS